MKAIYRGDTVALIPETDMEADFLAVQMNKNIYKMAPLQVGGIVQPCFELIVGKISDDVRIDEHGSN